MKKMSMLFIILLNVFVLLGCVNANNKPLIFFPTEKSDLHNEELMEAYKTIESDYQSNGEYEIFNLTEEKVSEKYNMDIFQVCNEKDTSYLVKHNEKLHYISPFRLTNHNAQAITNFAITDANKDGYIEIFTSIVSFNNKDKGYATSYIQILDTSTGYDVSIFDHDNVTYFKENEKGEISLFNAGGVIPFVSDISNGKLDEKYYDLATNLLDTPIINTSKYEFKERYVEAACDLYNVKISIDDYSIKFPYLFKTTYTPPRFKVTVEMTYLGETFSYVNGDGYLDGAIVDFVNDTNTISAEPIPAPAVVTPFTITTGMVINCDYYYLEGLDDLNNIGLYDMVINYTNIHNNINESIIIKDFLKIER